MLDPVGPVRALWKYGLSCCPDRYAVAAPRDAGGPAERDDR